MVSPFFFASDEGKRFPHSVFPGAMYVFEGKYRCAHLPGFPIKHVDDFNMSRGFKGDIKRMFVEFAGETSRHVQTFFLVRSWGTSLVDFLGWAERVNC